jgi:hypothetical protein
VARLRSGCGALGSNQTNLSSPWPRGPWLNSSAFFFVRTLWPKLTISNGLNYIHDRLRWAAFLSRCSNFPVQHQRARRLKSLCGRKPATSRSGRPPPPPLLVPADSKRAPWRRASSSRNSAPRGFPPRPPPARGGSSLPSGKVRRETQTTPCSVVRTAASPCLLTCCFPPVAEKYERDARRYWDIFYKRHEDKVTLLPMLVAP